MKRVVGKHKIRLMVPPDAEEIWHKTFVVNDANEIFRKTYQNVYAETYDKNKYYEVIISCPHAKNKESVKKIKIFNKHLLIHVGEREYRYKVKTEYVMPRLICAIYLPLPDDIKNILKRSVKNGIIYVEVGKNI